MKFSDIPKVALAGYVVTTPWDSIDEWLERQARHGLNLNPAYQRGYVWNTGQKIDYLEYVFKGGVSGLDIFWNCPGWMRDYHGPLELVDGKQRISAVQSFLNDEFRVFGSLFSEYEDQFRLSQFGFLFHVHNLGDPRDVVRWYLDMNTGGSAHTQEDLAPAYDVLEELSN